MGDAIKEMDYKKEYFNCLTHINMLKEENQILIETLNNLKGDKASDNLVNAVNAFYEPLLQDKFDEIKGLKEEVNALRKTIVRISNEKERIIDEQNIDYLSFASQVRHEICEKIRNAIIKDIDVGKDYFVFLERINQIEQGDE